MRLHSGLFQLCLFVAYSVANINTIEKDPVSCYTKIITALNDIINRASNLIDKYNTLKQELEIVNDVATDHENSVFVNEMRLSDAMGYKEVRNYDINQMRSDSRIKLFENIKLNGMKRENDYNKKVKHLKVYPSRSYTNDKSYNREIKAIDSSKDVIAFLKSLLQKKYRIANNIKRIENFDRPMNATVKYYSPSVWFIFLNTLDNGNVLNKLRSNEVIDADNLVVKYVKSNKHGVLPLDNLKKIELMQEDKNSNNEGRHNLEYGNGGTLRDGCIYCTKALLRKCFKAVKSSTKNTCRIYHCKSGFKSTFKSYGKTACLHEFTDDHKDRNQTLYYSICKKKSRHSMRLGNGGCDSSNSLRELKLQDRSRDSKSKDNAILNILRDKYDRACEKELYKKCSSACKCTIEATCDEHHCMKKKMKQLTKDCKAQCKSAFIKAKSSESEESTDSSDEDSEDTE